MKPIFVVTILSVSVCLAISQSPLSTAKFNQEEQRAAIFVQKAEKELETSAIKSIDISWKYATNITDYNEQKQLEYQIISSAISLRLGKQANKFDKDQIQDEELKRKLKYIGQIGTSVLEGDDLERYNIITNKMEKIYSTAKVPGYKDKSKLFSLDPELTEVMSKSRDADELEYYWTQWRQQSGAKIRNMYKEYLQFNNQAAKLNGYRDATEMKIDPYESDTFISEMDSTWRGLKPLYEQLHAYVRNKLHEKYGDEIVDPKGPIPAHLLGNMWAQSWNNLDSFLRPYPDKPNVDVTDEMKSQKWTQKIMFEKADDFFQSLGLDPMNDVFWEKSVIEKPTDGRDLVCHASAWDFQTGNDFRIKMCTSVNAEDFVTVNHEMGHVQYFMSYRNQSFLFRTGANPGFHEAVADILSLAVGTASYYQRLGLISKDVDITDRETNVNILMSMALQRLAFMPFGYLVDKYRWDLFSGWASPDEMNCHWTKLRAEIQGVSPPNQRSEDHFDAGAKYHVAANVGYVRYFTAFVYEFQYYRALCLVSKQYDPEDPNKPLHRCNFYGNKDVGKKLQSMLKLGASKAWKEAMQVLTGQPEMDTGAFREYFRPLEEWLEVENRKNNVPVGWKVPPLNEMCTSSSTQHDNGSSTTKSSVLLTTTIVALFFLLLKF